MAVVVGGGCSLKNKLESNNRTWQEYSPSTALPLFTCAGARRLGEGITLLGAEYRKQKHRLKPTLSSASARLP